MNWRQLQQFIQTLDKAADPSSQERRIVVLNLIDRNPNRPFDLDTIARRLEGLSQRTSALAFVTYPKNKTKTDLLESIKMRFDKEGIEIPFPYRTIVYKKDLEKVEEQHEKI